jgi:hypothetical protein
MIDLSETAKEAGLTLRTLITPAAWETFSNGGQLQGRDLQIRLLFMFRTLHAAITQRKGPREEVIYFSANVENRGNRIRMLKLRTVIKNLASSPSVVTIMLPEEGSGMKMSEEGISKD